MKQFFDYSSDMSSWYDNLLDLMLGLKDDDKEIKAFIKKRGLPIKTYRFDACI